MQGYKKIILTVGLAALLTPLMGQNTNSPYSRYGYGVLNDQAVGASKAMGGISYGVRGLNTNPGNPASYSGVDSLTFIFDFGISYVKSRLSEGSNHQNDDNGGLDYITMQFPITQKLGMSIGLLPYSSVGYSFGTNETTNELTSTKVFNGSGGFSQVYGGIAYSPIKNLSVGANISYLFGNTTYNRSLAITSVPSADQQNWHHKLTINAVKLDLGIQYALNLNKKDELILGAVYSPKRNSTGKINSIYAESNGFADTLTYTGSGARTGLPNTFGLGFTWNRGQCITVGADLTYQNWSKVGYSEHMDDNLNKSDRFNDRWRINAGAEYVADPMSRKFLKKVKVRGGLNYSNSYINVIDNNGATSSYKEFGATIGFGIPIKDKFYGRTSYINVGFEYRNLSPEKSNLIKEQYFGVTLGVTLNELWFMKNKFR